MSSTTTFMLEGTTTWEFLKFKRGLKRLHDRVDELRRFVFEDSNTFGTRFVPSKDLDSNVNANANTNVNLDDPGKP